MLSALSWAQEGALTLSKDIFKTAQIAFIPHTDEKIPFGQYLSMELPFAPIQYLCQQIQSNRSIKLINRQEAHITVITPIEYQDALARLVPIEEINQIAQKNNIQNASFEIRCLGRGVADINGIQEQTYFVVVKSPLLLEIRKEIYQLFIQRGGNPTLFDPDEYYPHITVGFTKQDLHYADGVIKDEKSCVAMIKVLNTLP